MGVLHVGGEKVRKHVVLSAHELETQTVWKRRYREARNAGLTHLDGQSFANGTIDIGLLRKCVKGHATPEQIRACLF